VFDTIVAVCDTTVAACDTIVAACDTIVAVCDIWKNLAGDLIVTIGGENISHKSYDDVKVYTYL
jgi:hypothetical protein